MEGPSPCSVTQPAQGGSPSFLQAGNAQDPTGGQRCNSCPAPVKPLGSLGVLKRCRNAKRPAGLSPSLAGTGGEKLIYFHNLQSPGEVDMARLGIRDGSFLSLAL